MTAVVDTARQAELLGLPVVEMETAGTALR
jgi:hypothetical protein